MVLKKILVDGMYPQWVDVPEDPLEQAGRTIREGYAKGPSNVLKSKYTGWNVKGALWRR
ncbi:hypothetical protein [Methanosarcina sp.]|uniref:hypothetical protein n=1 Tax=Methanosarcina sp. TaxID=2213 RepID=UPI002C35DD6D|nr:hypothetical protein [Methanosarcina sp.]HOW13504.1 hypothetical protein [Methanosarcina sp.]